MNDIVTRLRGATEPRLEMGWPAPHVVQRKEPLWIEAADEIERLRAKLAAVIKQRDGYRSALERIANEDYRGNRRKESQIAFDALAAADAARTAMRKGDANGK